MNFKKIFIEAIQSGIATMVKYVICSNIQKHSLLYHNQNYTCLYKSLHRLAQHYFKCAVINKNTLVH